MPRLCLFFVVVLIEVNDTTGWFIHVHVIHTIYIYNVYIYYIYMWYPIYVYTYSQSVRKMLLGSPLPYFSGGYKMLCSVQQIFLNVLIGIIDVML